MRLRHIGHIVVMAWSLVLLQAAAFAQSPSAAFEPARIRVITNDFVLPGKLARIGKLASERRMVFDGVYVESSGDPKAWLSDADLVILDTPRPMDAAKVMQRLGRALEESRAPWVRVGGGPPAFGNLAPLHARRLIGYYAAGGEANLRALLAFADALRRRTELVDIPAPVPMPVAGFYHPAALGPFASASDYLAWGGDRWKHDAPRVAIAIHSGLVSSMETQTIDALIAQSERSGLLPFVFWHEASDPEALQKTLGPAAPDVLIIATHLQNGPARRAEFLKLNIPAIQTVSYREGDAAAWSKSDSGMAQHLVAPFLAVPEGWGVSDPMVIDAVRNGEPEPITEQVQALVTKVAKLAALRRKPAADRKLALMFWNYPPGEKNLSASHLNVPRSLARVTQSLATAGYDVPAATEAQLIRDAQAMLAAVYHPEKLAALHGDGLAATLPVRRYRSWLETLPRTRRAELLSSWGDPETGPGVTTIDGEAHFVIPRLKLGKLIVMPQLPRSGKPGADYHDSKQPPAHAYLAAYLYLRAELGADALIHFGTHGTQEWTPGKDRGLSTSDYPYLTVGAMPVFYPYIQDNIAEAVQAKRRGRAVTISHQTPPFAPAGLYDEIRDLHAHIHDFVQLDAGAVRERTAAAIQQAAVKANLHRDLGWEEPAVAKDFERFLSALHDHLHELARHVMPLGLHTFGEAAPPDHRLSTVMQQLGEPFYQRVGTEPDEFFATDFKALQQSPPYKLLQRHLREGAPLSDVSDPALRADLERAALLDRHLAVTGEIEALLVGLSGGFVAPGAGGDPVRNPDVPSGRNLFPFEPDKIPTRAAYAAGEKALLQLVEAYRVEHGGKAPTKLAFSLWGSETMRHLGIVESQVLHALGLRPVWNEGGRIVALDIIPREELGRARIDTVLQVTSVYRDQFDGFMRLLSDAIARLAALEEPDNAVASNTRRAAQALIASGEAEPRATRLAGLRLFSNEMGDYGTDLPGTVLKSASWDKEAPLAQSYLARLQYAYGSQDWGVRLAGTNLFAAQLKGVEAAVLSRSSKLHGILSTDHPFEYLGGLSLAVRHLDGKSPALFIADLREPTSRIASAARFLSDELRARYLNPHWLNSMKEEGYAGTVEVLNVVNNLWGWQVTDPGTVRADQWQAMHDTLIRDVRNLELPRWFEQFNPTAQAQIVERMIEAIRKGYWDASAETQSELRDRWQQLVAQHHVDTGAAPATVAFINEGAIGFGLAQALTPSAEPARPSSSAPSQASPSGEPVRGQVLQPVRPSEPTAELPWQNWGAVGFILACLVAGMLGQLCANARLKPKGCPV